jgi:hypothetical protein
MMVMKCLLLFLIFIISIGCAQRIKVPVNRMMSPEAIGKGAEIEYRDIGFSSGVLDFSNNSTVNPLIMGTSKDTEFYLGVGIAENADLFVRVPEESSSLIGIKVQVIGEPGKAGTVGHNLAFTIGMGSERDEFDQVFTIDLKSDVTDYSLIHGYRLSPYVMVYEGISVSNYHFSGTVKGTTGLSSNEIDYQATNILGGHIGMIFGGASFKLKLELAAQKIQWSHTEEKLYQHFGTSLTAGW